MLPSLPTEDLGRADALAQSRGGNGDGTEGDGTLVTARGLRTQGGFA